MRRAKSTQSDVDTTREHAMTTNLTARAAAAIKALRQRFMPGAVMPVHGHDPRWREQQSERGERERALFQLRALGWPSA